MDKFTEVLSTFFVANPKVGEFEKEVSKKDDTLTESSGERTVPAGGNVVYTNGNAASTGESTSESRSESTSESAESTNESTNESTGGGVVLSSIPKYILKASEFHKKRIMIVNDTMDENIGMLSNMLHKLSLMRGVNSIYDKFIHVVAAKDNKSIYKKMLIDNPYLYFTDFDVRIDFNSFSTDGSKRTIYIVDFFKFLEYDNWEDMLESNCLIFIVATGQNKFIEETYEELGDKLLLYKANGSRSSAQKFFEGIVKPVTKTRMAFQKFYDLVKNDSTVVLKGNELRLL